MKNEYIYEFTRTPYICEFNNNQFKDQKILKKMSDDPP